MFPFSSNIFSTFHASNLRTSRLVKQHLVFPKEVSQLQKEGSIFSKPHIGVWKPNRGTSSVTVAETVTIENRLQLFLIISPFIPTFWILTAGMTTCSSFGHDRLAILTNMGLNKKTSRPKKCLKHQRVREGANALASALQHLCAICHSAACENQTVYKRGLAISTSCLCSNCTMLKV